MKKRKVTFYEGSFVDYSGETRPFVFAGAYGSYSRKTSVLTIGLSIVHPSDMDKIDDNLSKTIASNKALNKKTCLSFILTDTPFSKSVIEAILKQEAERFISNPKDYIANYERDSILYNLEQNGGIKLENEIEDLRKELEIKVREFDKLYIEASK